MGELSVAFNYSKLRGAIKSKGFTETAFANEIGMSAVSLSSKFNGRTGFTENEMYSIMSILEIEFNEVANYFFCKST